MLHIKLHDDESGKVIDIGTIAAFTESFINEIGSVATVILKGEFRKKAVSALDRVFQKAWDNGKIKR